MAIHRTHLLVSDDFDRVNELITKIISTDAYQDATLVSDLSTHILQSGGKRLRPLLVLLSCRACQYQGTHQIALAAMIEFFHTATLLHDDVIDDSSLRRGKKTANKIWGSKASILVGDTLFIEYFKLMIDIGNMDIMKLLADISSQITRGELRQMANRNNSELSVTDYFDVIKAKTSMLFAVSAAMGALITNSSQQIYQSLYDYGLHLGNAFQLTDDALDYCSDAQTLGKNIGDDLADGKATLPLIHALHNGTPAQKEKIQVSLQQGSLRYLPDILQTIKDTRAIEYTRKIASEEVDKALIALKPLPESTYKEALIELADYAVNRDH